MPVHRPLSRRGFLRWSAFTGAAALLSACGRAPLSEAPLLNLHNWPEYVSPETLSGFRRETGIFINETIFGSNEELMRSLAENLPGTYDLIVPTDWAVRRMIDAGHLLKLDYALLPNAKNLQSSFRTGRAHDAQGDYSVTKDWGTTGIIVHPEAVTEPVTTWADFWALAPKYSGRVVVVEAQDEVLGAALKVLGYSVNDSDPAHLAQAEARLMELRPHIGLSSDYFKMFQQGIAVLGLGWNGDAFLIREKYATPVQYIIPEEGALLWEDNWCLPASALHVQNAHVFINYVLRPEIAAVEAAYSGYATVVEPALALLDESVRADLSLYPPPAVMNRLERLSPKSPEEQQRRDAIWVRFVAG
ncbi:MAG: ABC transporter substrate-binding protein [Anaerolineales bacterium]